MPEANTKPIGHGGQTKDLDGDEEDGYDEVIYPVDFRTQGHIVDDEMHRIMVQSLRPGVRLTAIFDSCHSGSALDLPYIYSTQGLLKEPNLAKEAGQGLLGIVSSYAKGDLGSMASTAMGLFKKVTQGDDIYQKNIRTKTSAADVIMWSGSKDSQTSYVDALFPTFESLERFHELFPEREPGKVEECEDHFSFPAPLHFPPPDHYESWMPLWPVPHPGLQHSATF
jgi:hypothetical protein